MTRHSIQIWEVHFLTTSVNFDKCPCSYSKTNRRIPLHSLTINSLNSFQHTVYKEELWMSSFFYLFIFDIFRCCKVHDDCYDRISREGICWVSPKWEIYDRSGCTGCGKYFRSSAWKLRMLLMVEYRSSRLNQNKPFSGPVSTLPSSSAEFYSFSLSGRLRALGLIQKKHKLASNCKDRETFRFKVFRVNTKNAKELCTKLSTTH